MTLFYDNAVNTEPNAVNVKSFGAVGDGITNDYVAIQAAIDDIASTGGVLFIFP